MKEEGIKLNEAYTSETLSLIKFQQPNKIEEKVLSIRTTGTSKGSPSPSIFINQSFYNDRIAEAVSPLSGSAFAYYKFEYEGSFSEGGKDINKIKVIPRSRGDQVFEGYIYIIENLWAIHSLNLKTTVMGFPVRVRQNYAEVAPTLWMPVTHKIDFTGKALGFAGRFNYLATSSEYKVVLNKDLIAANVDIIDEKVENVPTEVAAVKTAPNQDPLKVSAAEDKLTRKQFRKMMVAYEKEALKEQKQPKVISDRTFVIDSMATKRDSAYWASTRPVPLSEKEVKGYVRDDSLALEYQARLTGKDSLNAIKRTSFKPLDLLVGRRYNLSTRFQLTLDPTVAQIYFNTVEGVNVNLSGRLRHQYDSLKQTIDIKPTVRYGLASNDFYAKGSISHRIMKQDASRTMYLEGGNFVQQFNEEEPIHQQINTLSSLLFRKNYMKTYEKLYVKAGYEFKPSPFISLSANVEWAQRSELYNQTDFSLFYQNKREYTSNSPLNFDNKQGNEAVFDTGFPKHQALILEANLSYRPGGNYSILNGKKTPLLYKTPEFLFMYRKGVSGALNSDVDFDQVQVGLNHSIGIGVRGRLQFELRAGTFFNNSSMFFMDYHHFDANRTFLTSMRPAGAFSLLDYYAYSTNNAYFSGHTHYKFRKFFFIQISEARFAGLKENLFFNYLKTEQLPHYYELGYSLDNVFRFLRLEAATSFTNGKFKDVGVRIGITSLITISRRD